MLLLSVLAQAAAPPIIAQPASVPPETTAVPALVDPHDPVATEIARVGETATRVALAIADDGRVRSCTVSEASASPQLDAEACRILSARTFPAPGGNDRLRTRSLRIIWRIEE